jgi:hypothetical protein
MLIPHHVLEGIVAGRVDRAFRRWKRATVKAGGTLTTAVGVLWILSIEPIAREALTEQDAQRSGNASLADLLAFLDRSHGDGIYRILFTFAGDDPRAALRDRLVIEIAEIDGLVKTLDRMDAASASGPWTAAAIDLIARFPGRRAPDLAARIGFETQAFKANVRKLKALGLTESLVVGYRLSPRGQSLIDARPARFAAGAADTP